MRFDLNSPRGPAHAIGTEFYPVLRLIVLPSILGRILVNFPIFMSKNRKFDIIKIPWFLFAHSCSYSCTRIRIRATWRMPNIRIVLLRSPASQ